MVRTDDEDDLGIPFGRNAVRKVYRTTVFIAIFILSPGAISQALVPDRPNPAPEQPSSTNYYPLEVGNEWHYRIEMFGSSNLSVVKVTKSEVIDGLPLARAAAG